MMRHKLLLLILLPLAACSTVERVTEPGGHVVLYDPKPVHIETGIASWYRDHRTASGERFDINALAGAHKKLPFGTKVRVVDLKTGKSIIIRINDRGPYIRGRVIDLTVGAARQLGMYERGICKVRVEVLREIPLLKKPNIHVDAAAKKKDDARSAKPKITEKPKAPEKPTVSSQPKVSASPKRPAQPKVPAQSSAAKKPFVPAKPQTSAKPPTKTKSR